jgi:hypothetical protein
MSNDAYFLINIFVYTALGAVVLFLVMCLAVISEKNTEITQLKDKISRLETESLDLLRDLAEFKKSQDEEVVFTPEGGYLIVKKGEANAQAGSCTSEAAKSL